MIRVQTGSFDPGTEINILHALSLNVGAVVSFAGYVRDSNVGQEVAGMFLEHYPGMTEKVLGKIADEACQRWPLLALLLIDPSNRSAATGRANCLCLHQQPSS
jgi:molybdopterin synthase catalytic subunit